MKNYRFLIAAFFILSLTMGLFRDAVLQVHAQSEGDWIDPVNLSNSGSSTNPFMIIDSDGTIHVFWLDKFDGYKYTNSTDGVTWLEPKTIETPFSIDPDKPVKPVILAGPDGAIHIIWMDTLGALQYSRATAATLGTPSSWTSDFTLVESSVKFDAVIDSHGALHIGYIDNLEKPDAPAGIYYRRLDGSGWSPATVIYPSKYYRSLTPEDNTNIQLAASDTDGDVNVYIAWDDRAQKRIFLAKSADGGKAWDGTFEVRGPEDFSGVEFPFNIDLGTFNDHVLLVWQAGIAGEQCVQFSQWSTDGAKQFEQPVKVLEEFSQCPQTGQFLFSDDDFSVVLFNTLNDLSLMAWNGSRWSTKLTQNEIASFLNPVTLDSVFLGCQNVASYDEKIYVAGCDTGEGGDIWFSSRPIGSIEKWFPPPSKWSRPETLVSADQKITSLLSTADNNNHIHNIWMQDPSEEDTGAMIQYAMWDGQKWSNPVTVIKGSTLNPSQLTLNLDNHGKLLLAWVDDSTGDLLFTWANSERASSASEWEKPVYIPSISSANSSPDIVTDTSGRMLVAFAVPINEDRGIYIVESNDFGTTWSNPYRIFDASVVNWHMVDRPHIALTGDGRLHILFERFTLWGDQRQSNGLYYIQSSDGGVTWSQAEQVSEQPILWSELISYGKSDLHRIWQEQRSSSKVSIHQISSDGGATWSSPVILSTLNNPTVINQVSTDFFGNLYYLQLTGPDHPSILNQRWEKTGWKNESPKSLDLDPKTWVPSSIVSSVSSDGHLEASILGDSPDPTSKWQSQILSLGQFLESKGTVPTPYPAVIASAPVLTVTQSAMNEFKTPTPDSPLAGINDTGSFSSNKRNMVGLFLVGGVVALMVLLILGTTRFRGKTKTKTD